LTLTRRARELVLTATLLALPLLFLRANLKDPTSLNGLDRLILRISAPIQAALTWAARGISHGWSRYVWLVGIEGENRRLHDENAQLRSDLSRMQHDNAHVGELEKLVGLAAKINAPAISARVVAVETSSFFRVVRVRLDVGDAPVKSGMPVVAPEGVVGRVHRAYGRYAEVMLAVDPKSSIDVMVARTRGRGTLKGIPGDNRYRTQLANFLRQDEVADGDLVVTTGADAFPRNFAVGKVAKVAKKDSGLWQDVEVEPAVDFARLDEVVVLLNNVDEGK
jgi:rod shape-determining protein MreC